MRKLIMIVCLISAAYPAYAAELCSRPDILKKAVNIAVCEQLFNCPALGFKDYEEIQNATPEQIARKQKNFEPMKQGASPASLKFFELLDIVSKNGLIGLPTFVQSASGTVESYDSVSKAYRCTAQLVIDPNVRKQVLLWHHLQQLLNKPDVQLLFENIRTEQDVETITKMILMTVSTSVNIAMRTATNQFTFVVQPKDRQSWFNTEYVVTVN